MNEQTKPRAEFLALAESCGAVLTGSPDGKVAVSVVFTPSAWRKFDRAALAAKVSRHLGTRLVDLFYCAEKLRDIAEIDSAAEDYADRLVDGLKRLIAATPAPAPEAAPVAVASQWQPIETAPKDGSLLLLKEKWEDEPFIGQWVSSANGGKWAASRTHYDTDGNACVIDRVYSKGVTHWQPLPPAPKEQQHE